MHHINQLNITLQSNLLRKQRKMSNKSCKAQLLKTKHAVLHFLILVATLTSLFHILEGFSGDRLFLRACRVSRYKTTHQNSTRLSTVDPTPLHQIFAHLITVYIVQIKSNTSPELPQRGRAKKGAWLGGWVGRWLWPPPLL